VAPGLGGLAQGVGGVGHRQAVGIGECGQVAVAGVGVAHGPGVGVGLESLGHGQAALVVQVAVGDAAGAAVVVRGDALGQTVGGVVPGLVAVVVGERERVDAVAGVVGAYDLAGQDGGGVSGGAARGAAGEAACSSESQVAPRYLPRIANEKRVSINNIARDNAALQNSGVSRYRATQRSEVLKP